MNIKEALNRVVNQLDLNTAEMQDVMREIMTGQCTDAQIGAFLMGLRMKSETIDEIVGAAQLMRELAAPVQIDAAHLVDTCGTGGDGMNIFNVSTAAAFVVAAAGGQVAKHGNRAVSGKSGSADLLETAGVKHQVLGVFSKALCRPLAEVLQRLGSEHVLVVHAQDGLDEISLAAPTFVAELKDGVISEYSIQPEDFGIKSQSLIGLTVDDAEQSLALIRDALTKRKGEQGQKAADMIVLNAGAALYAADLASSLKEGVQLAHDALHTGLAWEKLQELVSFTAVFKQENEG